MSQIVVNAIVSGAAYLLVSLGFSLIYISSRFFHFAHGVIITIGAYATFILWHHGDVPLAIAAVGGIAFSSVLGMGMHVAVFQPMRKRSASASTLLLASIGLYISLQAVISLIFGAGTQTFRRGQLAEPIALLDARLTLPQVGLIVAATCCWAIVWVTLYRTTAGRLLRAVASDRTLADAYGIRCDRVALGAFATGSALAGLAGFMLALDGDMTPTMGFQILLMGVVALIVGGVGSVGGAALGALLIAVAEHAGAWYLSSRWQTAIVFATLILFFLLKPEGFFGKPVRKAAV